MAYDLANLPPLPTLDDVPRGASAGPGPLPPSRGPRLSRGGLPPLPSLPPLPGLDDEAPGVTVPDDRNRPRTVMPRRAAMPQRLPPLPALDVQGGETVPAPEMTQPQQPKSAMPKRMTPIERNRMRQGRVGRGATDPVVHDDPVSRNRAKQSVTRLVEDTFDPDEARSVWEQVQGVPASMQRGAVDTVRPLKRAWGKFTRGAILGALDLMAPGMKQAYYDDLAKEARARGDSLKPAGSVYEQVLDGTIAKAEDAFEGQLQRVMEGGGVPAQVAYGLASGAWRTGMHLLMAKGVTGAFPGEPAGSARFVANTLRHASQLAAYNYVTTPGSQAEKTDAARMGFLYSATPAVSSGASTKALAVLFDMALNSGISVESGAYRGMFDGKTWSNDEARAEFISRASNQIVTDLLFSLGIPSRKGLAGTRGAAAETARRKAEIDQLRTIYGERAEQVYEARRAAQAMGDEQRRKRQGEEAKAEEHRKELLRRWQEDGDRAAFDELNRMVGAGQNAAEPSSQVNGMQDRRTSGLIPATREDIARIATMRDPIARGAAIDDLVEEVNVSLVARAEEAGSERRAEDVSPATKVIDQNAGGDTTRPLPAPSTDPSQTSTKAIGAEADGGGRVVSGTADEAEPNVEAAREGVAPEAAVQPDAVPVPSVPDQTGTKIPGGSGEPGQGEVDAVDGVPPTTDKAPQSALETERNKKQPRKRRKGYKGYVEGTGHTPIIDMINAAGGLIAKSRAKHVKGEYDNAPRIPMLGGFGRVVYGGQTLKADVAATNAFNGNLPGMDAPTTDALWRAIANEVNAYREARENKVLTEEQQKAREQAWLDEQAQNAFEAEQEQAAVLRELINSAQDAKTLIAPNTDVIYAGAGESEIEYVVDDVILPEIATRERDQFVRALEAGEPADVQYVIRDKLSGMQMVVDGADLMPVANLEGDGDADEFSVEEPAGVSGRSAALDEDGAEPAGGATEGRGDIERPKETTPEEWARKRGVTAKASQAEMFGKGAVGDQFVLRSEEQVDGDRVARERAAAEAAKAAAEKAQGDLFQSTPGKRSAMPKRSKPKAAPAAVEQRKKPPVAKSRLPDAPIEDFGEKIGGARKDYAATMRDAKKFDIATEALSKVWPEPNYAKLIDAGTDPWVVGFIRAARDEVPTKPRQSWKVARYVESVTMLRGMAEKIMAGEIDKERVLAKLNTAAFIRLKRHVGGRADLYAELGHDTSLKGITIEEAHFSIYHGEENVTKWIISKKAKATAFSNMPQELGVGNTREEAVAAFKERLAAAAETPKADKKIKFDIYSYRSASKPGYFIGKKIGRNTVDLFTFDTAKAAREFLRDSYDDVAARLAAFKHIANERRATNAPRVGDDYRNGKDATPEQFQEAFGFRGVEFGNYVEQNKRHADLNRAYDALMDLAGILNIPTKAISLNGELGLAFGARGHGGKDAPSAHYEPGRVVINLTKRSGAGSLAHEWWHAVDNYFARMTGKSGEMITDSLPVSLSAKGSRFLNPQGIREEMTRAFGQIIKTMRDSGLPARSKELDKRRSKPYFSLTEEMTARAFENYVVERLAALQVKNDYLANINQMSDFATAMLGAFFEDGKTAADLYPYLTQDEVAPFTEAFNAFFETVKTRETDTGVAMFMANDKPIGENDVNKIGGPGQRDRVVSENITWARRETQAARSIVVAADGTPVRLVEALQAAGADGDQVLGVDEEWMRSPEFGELEQLASDAGLRLVGYFDATDETNGFRIGDVLYVTQSAYSDISSRQILLHEKAHWLPESDALADQLVAEGTAALTEYHAALERCIGKSIPLNYAAQEMACDLLAGIDRHYGVEIAKGVPAGVPLQDMRAQHAAVGARPVRGPPVDRSAMPRRAAVPESKQQLNESAAESRYSMAERPLAASRSIELAEWPESMTVVHTATSLGHLKRTEGYHQAKHEADVDAAVKVVLEHATKWNLEALRDSGAEMVVPVDTRESGSMNAIPYAMAAHVHHVLGLEPAMVAVREKDSSNTGKTVAHRMANRISYEVDDSVRGKKVAVVDDNYTSGETIIAVVEAIQAKGGNPVFVLALSHSQAGNGLKPTGQQVQQLLDAMETTEVEFRHEYGFNPSQFTGSEIQRLTALNRAKDKAANIRKRIGSLPPDDAKGASGVSQPRKPLNRVAMPTDPVSANRVGKAIDAVREEDVRSYLVGRGVSAEDLPGAVREQLDWFDKISSASRVPYREPDDVAAKRSRPAMPRRSRRDKVLDQKAAAAAKAISQPTGESIADAFRYGDTIASVIHERVGPMPDNWAPRGTVIRSPQDMMVLAMQLRSPYQEAMKVVFLDAEERVLSGHVVTVGLLDASLVHVREVFRQAPDGTSQVLLAHNHPSGDPTPSHADIQITRKMVEAAKVLGLTVADHVITDDWRFSSLREEGLVSFEGKQGAKPVRPPRGMKALEKPVKEPVEKVPPAWSALARELLPRVGEPADLRLHVEALRQGDPDYGHVILLNTKNRISAIGRFKLSDVIAGRADETVGKLAVKDGTSVAMVVEANLDNADVTRLAKQLDGLAITIGIPLLDVIDGQKDSLAMQGMHFTTPREMDRIGEDAPSYNVEKATPRFMVADKKKEPVGPGALQRDPKELARRLDEIRSKVNAELQRKGEPDGIRGNSTQEKLWREDQAAKVKEMEQRVAKGAMPQRGDKLQLGDVAGVDPRRRKRIQPRIEGNRIDGHKVGPAVMAAALAGRDYGVVDEKYADREKPMTATVKDRIGTLVALEDSILADANRSLHGISEAARKKATAKWEASGKKVSIGQVLDVDLAVHDVEKRTGVPLFHKLQITDEINRDVDYDAIEDVYDVFDGLVKTDGKPLRPKDFIYDPIAEDRIITYLDTGEDEGLTDNERIVARRADQVYQSWEVLVKKARHARWIATGELAKNATAEQMQEGQRVMALELEGRLPEGTYVAWLDASDFGIRKFYSPKKHNSQGQVRSQGKNAFSRAFAKTREGDPDATGFVSALYRYVRNARRVQFLEPHLFELEKMINENADIIDPGVFGRYLDNLYMNREPMDSWTRFLVRGTGHFFRIQIPQKLVKWVVRNKFQPTVMALPRVLSAGLDPIFWQALPMLYSGGRVVGTTTRDKIQERIHAVPGLAEHFHRYVSSLDTARQEKLMMEMDQFTALPGFWRIWDAIGQGYTWSDTSNRAQVFMYTYTAAMKAIERYYGDRMLQNFKRLNRVTAASTMPTIEKQQFNALVDAGKAQEAAYLAARRMANSTQFRYPRAERGLMLQKPGTGSHVTVSIFTYFKGVLQLIVKNGIEPVWEGLHAQATGRGNAETRQRAADAAMFLLTGYFVAMLVNRIYEWLYGVDRGAYGAGMFQYTPGGPVLENVIDVIKTTHLAYGAESRMSGKIAATLDSSGKLALPFYLTIKKQLQLAKGKPTPAGGRLIESNYNPLRTVGEAADRWIRRESGSDNPRDQRKWIELTTTEIAQRLVLEGASQTSKAQLVDLYDAWKAAAKPNKAAAGAELAKALRRYPMSTKRSFDALGAPLRRDIQFIEKLVPDVDRNQPDAVEQPESRAMPMRRATAGGKKTRATSGGAMPRSRATSGGVKRKRATAR